MTAAREAGADRQAATRALAGLAHELRNPLAVIAGYAELLKTRSDERTRLQAAEQIVEAVDVVTVLVDDLVTSFAVAADALVVEPAVVELDAVVDEGIAAVERRAPDHTVVREGSDDGHWPRVHADPAHVVRIVRDLVAAACLATPDGGEVRVGIGRGDDFAAVRVMGPSSVLAKEDVETLLDRLEPIAVRAGRDVRSTGLELYKVRRLVEAQSGTLEVERGPGTGTTVVFTLPLHEAEVA